MKIKNIFNFSRISLILLTIGTSVNFANAASPNLAPPFSAPTEFAGNSVTQIWETKIPLFCSVWKNPDIAIQVSDPKRPQLNLIQSGDSEIGNGYGKTCVNIPALEEIKAIYCGAANEGGGALQQCLQGQDCNIGWIHAVQVMNGPSNSVCVTYSNESRELWRHIGVVVQVEPKK